jgi:hypothetical protein
MENDQSHGILISPAIARQTLKSQGHLNKIIKEMNPATVTVRGHGWSFEKKFVWTGTAAEFNETWECD